MSQNTISTWTLKSPIKFALFTFGLQILVLGIFILGMDMIAPGTQISKTAIMTFITLATIFGIAFQIRALPRDALNNKSFVSIHNAQMLVMLFFFFISFVPIAKYQLEIFMTMMHFSQQHPVLTVLLLSTMFIFSLYLLGVLTANIYAKFLRARTMGIPAWKIILTMPFAFCATWIPGYFLSSGDPKTTPVTIKSQWYNSLTDWILSRKRTTVLAFVGAILIAHFYMGSYSTLLSFSFALIFGIWILQIGTKKFLKNIDREYTNITIVLNIIMVITFITISAMRSQEQKIIANNNSITPETIEIIDTPKE